jgi:molybdate-binding protein/DNA-binding XRE family transcriptional regulator
MTDGGATDAQTDDSSQPPPTRAHRVPSDVRLRLARLAARLSQQELANVAGVSRQAVAGLESGRWNPSLRVALDLARALGMSVEELFGPGEPPPPIDVSLLSDAPPVSRLDLAVVRGRAVALPLTGGTTVRAGFIPATGTLESVDGRWRAHPFGVMRPTIVIAGCDPALALLQAPLARLDPPIALAWWPCSTSEAVRLAAAGLVHAAAAHLALDTPGLADGETDGAVVGFTSWREGLVLHPDRASKVSCLADVARSKLHLVNREIGAEARSVLESLRVEEAIPVQDLAGYSTEARGHLEVAAAIDAGLADVGPASEPAGLAYGLSFLPVATELCELRIAGPMLETREVQALLRVLVSPKLRIQIESLPGYDAAICGELLSSG